MEPIDLPSTRGHALLGTSDVINDLRADIEAAAASDAKVLLMGETGSGKEVVAREIHQHGRRRQRPFVTINCAGIPDTLLESELFGHTRGSFTGAFRDSPGLLRQANGGTVFLDEVGEMSLRMQALFLRFLETGEIQTVGGGVARVVTDVRVITATNRNLRESAAAQEFRMDLYYRLNVFAIVVPPLREHRSDIPLLLDHYLEHFCLHHGRPRPTLTDEVRDLLVTHEWPGNVRELRNIVERLVLRAGPVIDAAQLPPDIHQALKSGQERPSDQRLLMSHQGRVQSLYERLFEKQESFWTSAYPAFMARDITRSDLRLLVQTGLERTHGSYRTLVGLFNMDPGDYKRFLGFLKQHDCHLPFQRFRICPPRSHDAADPWHAGEAPAEAESHPERYAAAGSRS